MERLALQLRRRGAGGSELLGRSCWAPRTRRGEIWGRARSRWGRGPGWAERRHAAAREGASRTPGVGRRAGRGAGSNRLRVGLSPGRGAADLQPPEWRWGRETGGARTPRCRKGVRCCRAAGEGLLRTLRLRLGLT